MIKSITFSVMQIRVIFVLPSLVPPPSLGSLGSCPNRLPLDPALLPSYPFTIVAKTKRFTVKTVKRMSYTNWGLFSRSLHSVINIFA